MSEKLLVPPYLFFFNFKNKTCLKEDSSQQKTYNLKIVFWIKVDKVDASEEVDDDKYQSTSRDSSPGDGDIRFLFVIYHINKPLHVNME